MNKIKKGIGAAALASAAAFGSTDSAHSQIQNVPSSSLVDPKMVGDVTRGAKYKFGNIYYQGNKFAVQSEIVSRKNLEDAIIITMAKRDIIDWVEIFTPTADIALIDNRAYLVQ